MNPEDVVPWPADVAHAYRTAGCWQGRPLGSYLWDWADRWPDRVAVVDGDHRLTYLALAQRADRLAEGLATLGLGGGDTALVQLPNCWEFVVSLMACLRLGLTPVMMLPPHREYELASIGAHVGAKALIVPDTWRGYDHSGLARRVAAGLPEPAQVLVVGDNVAPDCVDLRQLVGVDRPAQDAGTRSRRGWLDERAPAADDIAVFLLSGGTTGVPKVIARTHDDYGLNIRLTAQVCDFGPDTVYLAVLPVGHNFPLASPGVLGALFAGGTVVLVGSPRPDAVFRTIEAEGVTVTSVVPAVAVTWAQKAESSGRDLSSLRYIHIGGSILSPDLAARIGPALGCRVQQVYGMAEGLICYTPVDAPDEIAFATQGRPVSPYDELLVVGPDGRPVAPGDVGELLTRGPYTPRGYYGAAAQNRVSYTSDGWYRTGDLVRITSGGNVVVCGRIKDLINRAGEKISAAEVESLVQELPEVAEVAAVAVPDPDTGERVCLFVRVKPGQTVTLAGVRDALTARGVAAFKIPERLEVLEELPYTAIGKPDKKALVRLVAERAT